MSASPVVLIPAITRPPVSLITISSLLAFDADTEATLVNTLIETPPLPPVALNISESALIVPDPLIASAASRLTVPVPAKISLAVTTMPPSPTDKDVTFKFRFPFASSSISIPAPLSAIV